MQGQEHLSVYRAIRENGPPSSGQRHFCKHCGSALWLWDPTWPALVHPQAGAIDTPLPALPLLTHIMIGSKPDWVEINLHVGDETFDGYPDESLAEWHRRLGLRSD